MYTSAVYNTIISLNLQTNEAVFSTLTFVQVQATKAGMCCGMLTFDQPLYLKSFKIKQEHHPDFKNICLCLGGFHQALVAN